MNLLYAACLYLTLYISLVAVRFRFRHPLRMYIRQCIEFSEPLKRPLYYVLSERHYAHYPFSVFSASVCLARQRTVHTIPYTVEMLWSHISSFGDRFGRFIHSKWTSDAVYSLRTKYISIFVFRNFPCISPFSTPHPPSFPSLSLPLSRSMLTTPFWR